MFIALKSFNMQYSQNWQIRIGINSGPAVAGVVGKLKMTYDLWSDDGMFLLFSSLLFYLNTKKKNRDVY